MDASTPTSPEKQNGHENVLPEALRLWLRTRLAHEAVMLEDAREVLAADRRRTDAHQSGLLGLTPSASQRGGLHIGDVYLTERTVRAGQSALKAVVLAAGLLAGGGAAAALPWVLSRLLAHAAPAAVQDRDWDLRIVEEE
jgi:hypothetical protein